MADEILAQLATGEIKFIDVLAHIEGQYQHHPTAFKNGAQNNGATENQGSARILYYAKLNNLSKEDTLRLFAEHYQNVLDNPQLDNHQNIRQFMQHGWSGVQFEGVALEKSY
ncbi:MAG: HopJ type III effector protein [Chitinophagaceae bacterium]